MNYESPPQPHYFFGNTFIQRVSRRGGERFQPHSDPTSTPLSNPFEIHHLNYVFVNSQHGITFIMLNLTVSVSALADTLRGVT